VSLHKRAIVLMTAWVVSSKRPTPKGRSKLVVLCSPHSFPTRDFPRGENGCERAMISVDWTAIWTAAGVIVAVMVAIAGGLSVWLFRIDRASQAVKHLAQSFDRLEKRVDGDFKELKNDIKTEISNLWNHKSAQDLRLQDHGERLSRSEAQLATLQTAGHPRRN
jgi:outer membrane murein-binding lipoprotein Lpp